MCNIEYMPEEYKGKNYKKNKYCKTVPRKWTDKEIDYMRYLLKKGYTTKMISESIGRSEVSVSVKLKRLSKKDNTYNKHHFLEKKCINEKFVNDLQPTSVLDLYCGLETGGGECYKDYNVTRNDINPDIKADYHKDSFKLLCELYCKDKKYDIIDLDPYGSAYDCFDLSVKMARKGLCVTLGEMGHKRWKRLDFVKRYYNINSLEDFNSDNLINHIIMIGLRNKKNLTVYCKKDWNNISRVWFIVEPVKILEQWG